MLPGELGLSTLPLKPNFLPAKNTNVRISTISSESSLRRAPDGKEAPVNLALDPDLVSPILVPVSLGLILGSPDLGPRSPDLVHESPDLVPGSPDLVHESSDLVPVNLANPVAITDSVNRIITQS